MGPHIENQSPVTSFASQILRWHTRNGRHDLPWGQTRDPYRVWLSEVMLQQTQVSTVMGYYPRFVQRFPDVWALASASIEEVLPLWAGLGYYARARHLHACAQRIVKDFGGVFPKDVHTLMQLPGIGRSTAAAIASFCFNAREAILDGNVKRVLTRCFGIEGYPGHALVTQQLWTLATTLLPHAPHMPAYTQAMMDLGATVCTRHAPRCADCPLRAQCVAKQQGRVAQLPASRPARPHPERTALWLILIYRGQVLLERRAHRGLWGGLLTPPQFDTRAALNARLSQLGLHPTDLIVLPQRRHRFTHFTLRFTPYVARIRRAPKTPASPSGQSMRFTHTVAHLFERSQWCTWTRCAQEALPAAVRQLVEDLQLKNGLS